MSTNPFTIVDAKREKRLVFDVRDVDGSVLNSVRRVILSEIPNVAIAFDPYHKENSDITFVRNTSSLHNEFMGHRISLIPLQFPIEEIEDYNGSRYKFVLNVHNQGAEIRDVTTDDIRIIDTEIDREVDPDFHDIVFPKSELTGDAILITRLKPNLYNTADGEHLHAEFFSRTGIAKQHSRFSPVSTCTYYNLVDDELANAGFEQFVQAQEEKLKTTLSATEKENLRKRFNVHDRERFYYRNEYDEANQMRFTIESECRLTPVYLVNKAIDILIEKLVRISTDTDESILAKSLDKATKAFAFTIFHEDHTIGYLIQALTFNMRIRNPDKKLTYIGYYLPHPLVHEIVVKVMFDKSCDEIQDERDALAYFVELLQKSIIPYMQELKKHWNSLFTQANTKKAPGSAVKKAAVKKAAVKKDEAAAEEDEAPAPKARATKTSKKAPVKQKNEDVDSSGDDAAVKTEKEAPKKTSKKAAPIKTKKNDSDVEEDTPEEAPKPAARRGRTKATK